MVSPRLLRAHALYVQIISLKTSVFVRISITSRLLFSFCMNNDDNDTHKQIAANKGTKEFSATVLRFTFKQISEIEY
jgi:hypothetical protein